MKALIALALIAAPIPANAQIYGTPHAGKQAPPVACSTIRLGQCSCVWVMIAGRRTLRCIWL
jgi:hypothetical protein